MKRHLFICLLASGLIFFISNPIKSQTVSTFEGLTLAVNSYWNGSSQPMGIAFSNGNAIFPNLYDTAYGGYWSKGWAYSNMKDSSTSGFTNMYSARPAAGVAGSSVYAVGQQGSVIRLTGNAAGKVVYGVYITNGTYDALSMRDGDAFAKKFGGPSGNDPDWFKLSITGYYNGSTLNDTVNFYLADYRFGNNTQDYIVTDWRWVDLTPLGNLDSLSFSLTSSDTGSFGMNTPPFFCIDNFITADSPAGIAKSDNADIHVYPNPACDFLIVELPENHDNCQIQINDLMGKILLTISIRDYSKSMIDLRNFATGIYEIKMITAQKIYDSRFVKITER